jgi:hypothetical protein
LRGAQRPVKTKSPRVRGIDHQCRVAHSFRRGKFRNDGKIAAISALDADQHNKRSVTIGALYRRPAGNPAPSVANAIDTEGEKRVSLGNGRNVIERRRPFADNPKIGIHGIDDLRCRAGEAVEEAALHRHQKGSKANPE